MSVNKLDLEWRVHTPNLLKEVMNNPTCGILKTPIQIFGLLLHEVADRSSELNDPKLNKLMIQLALYSQADPESPDYDKDLVDSYLGSGQEEIQPC